MPQAAKVASIGPKVTQKIRSTPAFDESYQKLNAAQKKAVDVIEGPVMVIAGPGTGKTQTLAMRVANILAKTQMRPSNILCLTFSTSGAKAMRERLRSIIGPDAYGITIDTVHSFCNHIILEHPHVFEDFRAYEQVTQIEQLRIMRRLMEKLGVGSILGKPSLEHDRASAILNRISTMKREGISPDDLAKIVPEYRSEIETTKSGKPRDQKSQSYKDDQRLVQQFEEFILLYRGYDAELKETHRYDYADMILVVIEALKRHDWLLAGLQERYQYVLVDEFQDLNGSQARVIDLLTRSPIEGEVSNVFVVGDDDQAIYRFQGASPANMLHFLKRFPKATIISLTENYRSAQEILDAAAQVIEQNEERLVRKVEGLSKDLKAQKVRHAERSEPQRAKSKHFARFPSTESSLATCFDSAPRQARGSAQHDVMKPVFLRYPAIENERAGIAKILKDAHESGIPWTEMAVLCRRNEELTDMYEVLHTAGIPVILTANQDLMLHPEVREAMLIMQAVEHLNHDAVVSAALGCKTFDCHPAELGRLWCALRKMKHQESITLREFLLSLGEDLPLSIKNAYDLLESLNARKDSITLPELLEKILKESGLLPAHTDSSADPRRIAGLHAFYDYVKSRVYENKGLTLTTLLSDLDQYLTERSLTLEYAVPHLVSDGVELMTAHGAKGLEFTLVIVPHLRFRNWGNNIRGSLLSLPDHLILGIEAEIEKNAKQEDERRLMYVALTRAKEQLILAFSETYRSGDEIKDAEPSVFIAEAGDKIEECTVPPEQVPAPLETLHMPGIIVDDVFRVFLLERLEDFQLSVTALNTFLRDPKEFLWAHLLQQPQAKAPHLSFGTVVHAALEQRNLAWQAGEEFETSDLVAAFEKTLIEREVFTEKERAHFLHQGRELLTRYGEETASDHPIILTAERALIARLIDANGTNIPLFGKVDRIDLLQKDGQNCRIIDYKTGNPKKTQEAVRKDEGLFRQLVFYKLLCDLSPSFSHTATLFTLDFLGNEKEGRRLIDFEITAEEAAELTELIKKVWGKIVALDFTPLVKL
ncbi:MAG TPA: ATP-dependent DNA helicase [Candidatus Peribacterales bacterium]|nr:ATP-dependent DNA helicase [Candidatus Peribacterales bacterium]